MIRRNLQRPPTKEEFRAEASELEKRLTLWTNVEFQKQFIEPLERDLKRIEESQWTLSGEELSILLREFGFPTAQTGESLLTLFLCARSVVGFWRKRLRPFREAERKLNELRKEQEIGG